MQVMNLETRAKSNNIPGHYLKTQYGRFFFQPFQFVTQSFHHSMLYNQLS